MEGTTMGPGVLMPETPTKSKVFRMELMSVENGYTIGIYGKRNYVFLTLEEAIKFISDNMGKEL